MLFRLTADGDKYKLDIAVNSSTTKEVIWMDAMVCNVNIDFAYRFIYWCNMALIRLRNLTVLTVSAARCVAQPVQLPSV